MKDSIYSNENASTEAERATENASIVEGVVDAVFSDGTVRVRISPNNHHLCQVNRGTSGDGWLPSVNETAIIARRTTGQYILLGTFSDGGMGLDAGERVIGHSGSESRLKMNNDGSIDIIPDGAENPVVTLTSDGMKIAKGQVVTDIDTTTDSDGHVTSVSPVYTDTLSL